MKRRYRKPQVRYRGRGYSKRGYLWAKLAPRTSTGTPHLAHMGMPKIRVTVDEKIGQKALNTAERLWPGQGQRAVNRLSRDAISRFLRYLNDGSRSRS